MNRRLNDQSSRRQAKIRRNGMPGINKIKHSKQHGPDWKTYTKRK